MNAQDAFKQVHSLSKNKQAFAKITVSQLEAQYKKSKKSLYSHMLHRRAPSQQRLKTDNTV